MSRNSSQHSSSTPIHATRHGLERAQAAPCLTVNFGGTVGEIFVRQAMVRWTQKVGAGPRSATMLH